MFLNHGGHNCTCVCQSYPLAPPYTSWGEIQLDSFWRWLLQSLDLILLDKDLVVKHQTNFHYDDDNDLVDHQGALPITIHEENWRDFGCGSFSSLLPRPWGAVATCYPILQHCSKKNYLTKTSRTSEPWVWWVWKWVMWLVIFSNHLLTLLFY